MLLWMISALLSAAAFTTDIGPSLESVMDAKKLKGACQSYFTRPNKYNEVLCGKSIFFNLETRTDLGIPNQMLKQMKKTFPKEFNKVGFYKNPLNPAELLGVVKVKPLYPYKAKELMTLNDIRQISCAGCHVGQLPDGRWSVGYPNYNLNVGQLNILFTFSLWLADSEKYNTQKWFKPLINKYNRMKKTIFQRPWDSWMMLASYLPGKFKQTDFFFRFLEQDPPSMGDQVSFIYGKPGIYNAASPIINFANREFYTTPPQIWDMNHKTDKEEAYLGTITSVHNLESFIKHAFAYTNLTHIYSVDKYVKPLATYLRSLKTPMYKGYIDQEKAKRGKVEFQNNCMSCHDGRNGASTIRHPVETVNSPSQIDSIFLDYTKPTQQSRKLMESLQKAVPFEPLTYGIKARRLNGIWSKKAIMTNGSIKSLDHLFCLNGKTRAATLRSAHTQYVHQDLCHYSLESRENLKNYLLTL
jgi:hypothetical protein